VCKRRFGSDEGEELAEEQVEEEVREEEEESGVLFLQSRARSIREGHKRRKMVMTEAEEVEGFRQMLMSWDGCCMVCQFNRQEWYHEVEDCPGQDDGSWEVIQTGLETMEIEMFRKKQFESFTGCFDCGMPQWICQRWRVMDDDGGRFERVQEGYCQYKGLLLRVYVGLMVRFQEEAISIEEMMTEEGYSGVWEEQYGWFRGLIKWGGLQSSRLCRVCYRLWQLER
jgi:hypothetical protein